MLSEPLKRLYLVAVLECIFSLCVSGEIHSGLDSGAPSNHQREFVKTYLQAERGDSDAQYKVGMVYYSGQGLPRDKALAVLWFNSAAG